MTPFTSSTVTTTASSRFVRKYLYGIFLIFCLVVLSVFWGFSYKAGELIENQLHQQGVAFFQEVVIARKWAANHGGVYVKLGPDVEINPYLSKIPGLKVIITDQDGERYTLKNPALMTREMSELAVEMGLFRFKITSRNPLNPGNAPDPFERASLARFEQGAKEHFDFERHRNEVLYRYMAPLVTEKPCLKCHGSQGYRVGDIRGGISVSIRAGDMMEQLKRNNYLLFLSAAGIVAILFALIYFISQVFINDLKAAEQRLVEMASRDFLTGLFNRRETFTRLESEVSRADRNGSPLSIIMFDIDHFKKLNDTYGHDMGDAVLRELSARLLETVRQYDIPCRYGGEEFLVVAPGTTCENAGILAERLRSMALDMAVPCGTEGRDVRISISIGVAERIAGEPVDNTISRADAALYRAKEGGRNRVETA